MRQSKNKKREVTAALYVRLSRDDNLEGDSYSIGNQKKLLTKIAKEKGIKTVAFVGKNGGELRNISDIILDVPSDITNNIQELHIIAGHIICERVEEYFYKNS